MSGVSVINDKRRYDFLNLEEAAALVEMDPRTLRRRIEEGRLIAFRPGRRFRIRRADLLDFMMDSLLGCGDA